MCLLLVSWFDLMIWFRFGLGIAFKRRDDYPDKFPLYNTVAISPLHS